MSSVISSHWDARGKARLGLTPKRPRTEHLHLHTTETSSKHQPRSMMTMPSITVGRSLLTLSGVFSIAGPFAADWNETHVLNPRWPPHALFHNGQSMSMTAVLGLSTLYYTWRSYPTVACGRQGVVTATLLGSLYWASGLSAILYPGAL